MVVNLLRIHIFFAAFLSLTFECSARDSSTPHIRKVSEVTSRATQVVQHYSDSRLASYGILDVTKPPYSADNSGKKDVTLVLQQAIIDARDAQMVCFLPEGKYLVSETLEGVIGVIQWDSWPYEGDADPWVAEASFEYPCVLLGSRGKKRAVIVLADNAPGFDDPSNPKPVIFFWARSMQSAGPCDPKSPQPNINFNQKIMSIDMDLGEGNPGAIGIDHSGAEGSTVEDIHIEATGAFAGIRNAPGSGGAMHRIKVHGGRYGLYLPSSQPSPLISDLKLSGQSEASVFCRTSGPLTIVGAEIEGAPIKGVVAEAAWSGAINIIDSVIRIRSEGPAIDVKRSLVLDNVWINGCKYIAAVHKHPPVKGEDKGWNHVRQYVASGIQNYPKHLGSLTSEDPVWTNQRLIKRPILSIEYSPHSPEKKVLDKHELKYLPDWRNAKTVNVKESPFNAKGNAEDDDTAAIQTAIDNHEWIFLPKGRYLISKPLQLKANTKLFGLTNILTEITSLDNSPAFSDVDNPRPLIETIDDPNAKTALQMMKLLVPVRNPCVYALHWRAGSESMVRNIYPIRSVWHPHAISMGHPMVVISDSGGGRWYTQTLLGWWSQGPDYRHLLVNDTCESLSFYHLQPQHALSDAMVEFRNAQNIDVYSMKSEGDVTAVLMKNCENIRLFGYSGNGSPSPGRSIIHIENCRNLLLANISPQMWSIGKWWGPLGIFHNPKRWNILEDGSFKLNGMEQFALYQLK